ncbi:uncharacterized protein A4U43_C01F33460 [Asparagus officinalis]|uniref:Uncharacterized protein n=1 Tax=Asparagus officinalis TaxID=4686 RepID=A0A5P1FU31_ASPOF|nr:uncharacterized protein A4U43_C01F33460 [Asparagus officinalis]
MHQNERLQPSPSFPNRQTSLHSRPPQERRMPSPACLPDAPPPAPLTRRLLRPPASSPVAPSHRTGPAAQIPARLPASLLFRLVAVGPRCNWFSWTRAGVPQTGSWCHRHECGPTNAFSDIPNRIDDTIGILLHPSS